MRNMKEKDQLILFRGVKLLKSEVKVLKELETLVKKKGDFPLLRK